MKKILKRYAKLLIKSLIKKVFDFYLILYYIKKEKKERTLKDECKGLQ